MADNLDDQIRAGLIEYGKASTKAVFVLNGSAIIAILALAGQFTNKPLIMRSLAENLTPFLVGLVAAAGATLATYLSFYAVDARWSQRAHCFFKWAAWLATGLSLAVFVCGCWQVRGVLLATPV